MTRTNREIQKDADDLLNGQLRDLFKNNNYRLGENRSTEGEEEGIDFFFEVFNRTSGSHEFLFLNQNKGTDKEIKPISKKNHPAEGKISFQLDLKHVKYFYSELAEPLIFTYCDINKKVIYWYAIQLDDSIPERIKEQEKKNTDSLQIYIDPQNELNQLNFNRLVNEIYEAKSNQIRKKYSSIIELQNADYAFIKEKTQKKKIIDKLIYTIELFENFEAIPRHILEELYPFKKDEDSRTFLNEYTLRTDNEELLFLFENLTLNLDQYEIGNDILHVGDLQKKLEKIFDFFEANLIVHIGWSGATLRERNIISLQNLFRQKMCNCERCTINKLNFKKTNELLNLPHPEYTTNEKLRKAYAAYLSGDFNKSTHIFYEVYKETVNKKPVNHITAKYNLIQLKKIDTQQFFSNQNTSEILAKIDYSMDELFIQQKAKHFLDIFRYIKNYHFSDSTFKIIDDNLFEINRLLYNDSYGGWNTRNYRPTLQATILRIISFFESNLLIYDYYSEFRVLITKAIECMFVLHSIKNPNTPKYKSFDFYTLKTWLFYVDYKDANFLLKKYDIDSIVATDLNSTISTFNEYLDNLYDSIEILESNEILSQVLKIERILNNITLILSRLKLNKKYLNQTIAKLLHFAENVKRERFCPLGALTSLLSHQKEVDNNNVLRIIRLVAKRNYKSSNFSYLIKYFVERSTEKQIEKVVFELLEVKEFSKELVKKQNSRENYFRDLWYAFTFLNTELKSQLKKIITESLDEEFDADLFRSSTLFEIIPFNKSLFNRFLESIPDESHLSNEPFYRDRNMRLSQAINIAFKFNIPFDEKLRKYSSYSTKNYKDYYDWIMNIEGFDYSKFDPTWLFVSKTKYSIRAYKNSDKLLKEIRKLLNHNYIEGVAKMYLNELTNNE
ncbi:DUF4365 domain-containing protein [Aquimarina sp. 2304DJ70-9]|uniref:DUF4365 domain-containing protein n=1 Tax=Aquimarina penaris TaxID=3231044 RepID=UPI00346341A7